MSNYKLILRDAKEATNTGREALKNKLIEQLGISETSVDNLFSSLPAILKQNLDSDKADRYYSIFEELGASVELQQDEDLNLFDLDDNILNQAEKAGEISQESAGENQNISEDNTNPQMPSINSVITDTSAAACSVSKISNLGSNNHQPNDSYPEAKIDSAFTESQTSEIDEIKIQQEETTVDNNLASAGEAPLETPHLDEAIIENPVLEDPINQLSSFNETNLKETAVNKPSALELATMRAGESSLGAKESEEALGNPNATNSVLENFLGQETQENNQGQERNKEIAEVETSEGSHIESQAAESLGLGAGDLELIEQETSISASDDLDEKINLSLFKGENEGQTSESNNKEINISDADSLVLTEPELEIESKINQIVESQNLSKEKEVEIESDNILEEFSEENTNTLNASEEHSIKENSDAKSEVDDELEKLSNELENQFSMLQRSENIMEQGLVAKSLSNSQPQNVKDNQSSKEAPEEFAIDSFAIEDDKLNNNLSNNDLEFSSEILDKEEADKKLLLDSVKEQKESISEDLSFTKEDENLSSLAKDDSLLSELEASLEEFDSNDKIDKKLQKSNKSSALNVLDQSKENDIIKEDSKNLRPAFKKAPTEVKDNQEGFEASINQGSKELELSTKEQEKTNEEINTAKKELILDSVKEAQVKDTSKNEDLSFTKPESEAPSKLTDDSLLSELENSLEEFSLDDEIVEKAEPIEKAEVLSKLKKKDTGKELLLDSAKEVKAQEKFSKKVAKKDEDLSLTKTDGEISSKTDSDSLLSELEASLEELSSDDEINESSELIEKVEVPSEIDTKVSDKVDTESGLEVKSLENKESESIEKVKSDLSSLPVSEKKIESVDTKSAFLKPPVDEKDKRISKVKTEEKNLESPEEELNKNLKDNGSKISIKANEEISIDTPFRSEINKEQVVSGGKNQAVDKTVKNKGFALWGIMFLTLGSLITVLVYLILSHVMSEKNVKSKISAPKIGASNAGDSAIIPPRISPENNLNSKPDAESKNVKSTFGTPDVDVPTDIYESLSVNQDLSFKMDIGLEKSSNRVHSLDVLIKQQSSPELTPDQLIKNEERLPWLRRFEADLVKEPLKEGEAEPKTIVKQSYAYIDDGSKASRTPATLTINPEISIDTGEISGTWTLKSSGAEKFNEGIVKKVEEGKADYFEIYLEGSFLAEKIN